MQVTETLSQGLKREFKVVLPAAELEERLTTELTALKDRVRINGFRPGKVPVAHLRKLYGRSVMKDVLATALNEAERKIVEENDLRLANPPRYDFPEDQAVLEQAADAKIDLAVTVGMEVLPSFELADLSDVSLRKLVAPVSETDLQDALERMARQNRTFSSKAEDAAAETGDRVVIDFTGTVEGKPFQGGDGKGIPVELGSGSFMPGFEEQLAGVRAGERRSVQITFPPNYLREDLAGKDAVFDVTVSAVEAPSEIKIDDELAKSFGMETLERLKDAARAAIERDFAVRSRTRLKKQLLDALDAKYGFELPPSLVEQEFAGVWAQVEADMKDNGKTFADEGTTEEEARTEYRRISERRVRLGLVLARMGEDADISVSDEEVNRALAERIRMYPAQDRKRVWDYYQKDPQARAQIRAPLFEEKVVDHLLSLVKVVEEPVAKEVLFQDDEDEDGKPAEAASKPTP